MAAFEQQTFLGCTIVSFNGGIGWGGQSSTLNVTLVEDKKVGQYLTKFETGFPKRFQFGNWTFDGILNSITPKRSVSGNRIIDVVLASPTEIIKGVQLLLSDYIHDLSASNVYNIYGYWENELGFGGSETNDNGMLWGKVSSGLLSMSKIKPITYKGFSYFIDLSQLPNIPSYYRISNKIVSLYEFIEDICETGSHDCFIELSRNIITVKTVDRRNQPSLGRISQFIEEATAAGISVTSSNIGIENEYNPTTKIVIGGPREDIYFQFSNDFNTLDKEDIEDIEEGGLNFLYDETFADDIITQYWGLDQYGNVIIQKYINNSFSFVLDGYPISIPSEIILKKAGRGYKNINNSNEWELDYRNGYPTDENEIRAAMVSQESWEAFLIIKNNEEESIHIGKASKLGISGNLKHNIVAFIKGLTADKIQTLSANNIFNFGKVKNRREEIIRHVYQYLKSIGDNYYGKKFMVRIPFVYSKYQSETGRIITSLEPNSSGYLENQEIAYGIEKGLLPFDIDILYNEEGKIEAFGRGGFIHEKSSSVLFDHIRGNFYKVDIEPKIVFLNRETQFSPRVVINTPVFISDGQGDNTILTSSPLYQLLLDQAKQTNVLDPEDVISKFFRQAGAEGVKFPSEGLSGRPDLVAVPLKSNIDNYGPWQSSVGGGKASVEINNDMVPWVFGSYKAMNNTGNSLVSQAYSNRFTGESGSLDVVGSPSIQMGAQLIYAGPYITDINVTVDGNNGVTTSYRMNRWSTDSNKLLIYNIDKFKELARLKRDVDKKNRIREVENFNREQYRSVIYKKSLQGNTSNNMLMANTFFSEDGSTQSTTVVSSPNYNAVEVFGHDPSYKDKAGMSMDGMFRPFSTNKSQTKMPHLEIDDSGSTSIASSLNPFKEGNDISIYINRQTEPDDVRENIDYDDIRALGLRAPVILVGYGYDTNGKPVPNEDPENPNDNFSEDYLINTSKWKAGPLDTRWDDTKKCWIAGGGNIKKIFLENPIFSESGVGILEETGESVNIYNVNLVSGSPYRSDAIPGNSWILAVNIGSEIGALEESWVPIEKPSYAKIISFRYIDGQKQNLAPDYTFDGVSPPSGNIFTTDTIGSLDNGWISFAYYRTTSNDRLFYRPLPYETLEVLTDVELHPVSGLISYKKSIATYGWSNADSDFISVGDCV